MQRRSNFENICAVYLRGHKLLNYFAKICHKTATPLPRLRILCFFLEIFTIVIRKNTQLIDTRPYTHTYSFISQCIEFNVSRTT